MKPGRVENNVWYNIKIEVANKIVKCYLNDELIFTLDPPAGPITSSITKDVDNNDLILKLVNSGNIDVDAALELNGITKEHKAKVITLAGSPEDRNSLEQPNLVAPVESETVVSKSFNHKLPAYSFTLIRFSLND